MDYANYFFIGERNPAALKIANDIIAAYKPESVEEMHEAIKEVFEPMFETIQAKWIIISATSSKSEKTTENRRNGYSEKKLKTLLGETEILIPRDRAAEFA